MFIQIIETDAWKKLKPIDFYLRVYHCLTVVIVKLAQLTTDKWMTPTAVTTRKFSFYWLTLLIYAYKKHSHHLTTLLIRSNHFFSISMIQLSWVSSIAGVHFPRMTTAQVSSSQQFKFNSLPSMKYFDTGGNE